MLGFNTCASESTAIRPWFRGGLSLIEIEICVPSSCCQCQMCSTPLVALFLFAYFQYRNKDQFHSIPLLHIDNNNQLKVAQHLI